MDDLPLPSLAAEHAPGVADGHATSAAAAFAASLKRLPLCQEMCSWAMGSTPHTMCGLTARDSAGVWGRDAPHAATMPPASIVCALAAASRLPNVDTPPALNDQLAMRMCREHSLLH